MLRHRIRKFLNDESGAAGADWAFVASILVLGSVVGLLAVRAEMFGQSNILERTAQEVRSPPTADR